jgi:hypothetical protein
MKARIEYTDTFCGEANYCWVRRFDVESKTELGIVRKAKKELGLTGVRCYRSDFGDMVEYRPNGLNTVMFIDYLTGE